MHKIGIIVAMQREISGLVKDWRPVTMEWHGHRWRAFESGHAIVVCSGIGPLAAAGAAEALCREKVEVLISAGFAGALVPAMRAGAPLTPDTVVDADTGARFAALFGGGILVSATHVLRQEEKSQLAQRYSAQAADMEAATVAAIAERNDRGFLAVKAVSDTLDFPMPPVERFIDPQGNFLERKFAAHVAVRPHLWISVGRLARNNRKAMQTISGVLHAMLQIDDLRSVRGRLRSSVKFF